MQSSAGGGSGPGRTPAGRATSTSSAASPSSSSSAVSTPHLGFDSVQQQQQHQQQQQQIGHRQSFQQQLLRKPEGSEQHAYHAGFQGIMGGGNLASSAGSIQIPQQSRKFLDVSQQPGSTHDGQNRSQGMEQHAMNPVHQAYLQYAAFQASQQRSGLQLQQQAKMGMSGPSSSKDQEIRMGNAKIQDHMSMSAASQPQTSSSSKSSTEHFSHSEKQVEQGQQLAPDPRNDSKPHAQTALGQLPPANMMRMIQMPQPQKNIQNLPNYQLPQLQAMQAWAAERNIDLSLPANANVMAQLVPLIQSRIAQQPKATDSSMAAPPPPGAKQQVTSPSFTNDSSPHSNSANDMSSQSVSAKTKQSAQQGPFASTSKLGAVSNVNSTAGQQFAVTGKDSQVPQRQLAASGNGMPPMHPPQSSSSTNAGVDQFLSAKNSSGGSETLQMQYLRQLNRSSPHAAAPSNEGGSANHLPAQGGIAARMPQQHFGFTKQQLHVLKAQILAFRRLKKGEGTLPQELVRAIAPPPLEFQVQQQSPLVGGNNLGRTSANLEEQGRRMDSHERNCHDLASTNGNSILKEEAVGGDEKTHVAAMPVQGEKATAKEPTLSPAVGKEEQQSVTFSTRTDLEADCAPLKTNSKSDLTGDKGKAISTQPEASDVMQAKKPVEGGTATQSKDSGSTRKYHGPLFDVPYFTRKHDIVGSSGLGNNNNSLTLAYDVKDLLFDEGAEMLKKKRSENLNKISNLLAVNLEQKRIRPDLVLRLQIEEKKLRLLDVQARLRDEVDQQQQEIMAMPDRPYRKFVRLCERQRMELMRQVQVSRKSMREKQLKSIFQWRKKLLEAHWAIRDARTARNRGVAKYHEKMLREFSKKKDDGRNKRMEALKNNDVERYREMLLEQQTSMPGEASERYAVLSSFLSQTEEYLHKLGSKITATKNQQEVEEAAGAAAAAARLQGISEEEVRAAAACAGEEVMIRNRFLEMNAPRDRSSVSKYYKLAHAVTERVARQPSMLRAGTLRDYQLVGLQWMLSLYNNKLNGILADEMGLGKTVQVMALIAYLMEFKGNYGPHLIIVPNAVLVNWKSELHTWLPSVSCIYYVGAKEQRSKLFSQEVSALKFNVLVTTYEFIMYDRSKLSKVDWKYIVIDEAQRMKDRESVLARDLDRYRCQRRLLLTGTPLQNDLKELWSLLNLLLPEVFDNKKAFHDWFAQPFQKEGPAHNAEDDWLETEKKVIIIHRLHQILEPFMLRRRVEDVEGSLPPKISIVLRCRMSAIQSAVYDWIKSTGTLRVDPEDEKRKVQKNSIYQAKVYKTLNNRCMELRKVCNHPLLNYPYFNDFSKEFLVKSCGKLWILDRILIKLHRTGHRVLLFSTMTKLLDILEEYLQWRRLVYRRIDGTTSLEDRESAIVDFNSPGSDCFIFLLSIRAAGRGLNLQSADTVIIYDPDPNPKNEEQAVARAHRIGQTREVKVIYMEAVVDKIYSHTKEDELRSGGTLDSEDDLAGKDRYMASIEGLIRNNIQQYKIDMADEVINAGRFDQRTTHEERRMTLETLLHDDERYQETLHDVPSLQEVNRMISRSADEVELFDQMDEDLDWTEEMTSFDQVPKWLRASTKEVNAAIGSLSKKPYKKSLYAASVTESGEKEPERRRGRPKGKKSPNYKEMDDGEYSEASFDEKTEYSVHEEEEENGEFEDAEFNGNGGEPSAANEQSEDDGPTDDGRYAYHHASERSRQNRMLEEAGSSGSSSDSLRATQIVSPVSSQKFGSLSALEARPGSVSKRLSDELEEGEIGGSGDSHMDHQQSGSWNHDRDEGEDEQVLQPKIKRKRSIRIRPRHTVERAEEKSVYEAPPQQRGDSSLLHNKYQSQPRVNTEMKSPRDLNGAKLDRSDSAKTRRNMPSRKSTNTSKSNLSSRPTRSNLRSASAEDAVDHMRESWDAKGPNVSGTPTVEAGMSDIIQRKCKSVIGKLQRRIEREGHQIVPLLTDLWKRIEKSGHASGAANGPFHLKKIEQRIERLEYSGVPELVVDVQLMLKSAMQYYSCSHEVRTEGRKVHDLFFDILKIAFPGADFQEAKSALSFSAHAFASTAAQAVPSRRNKLMNEMEPDVGLAHKSMVRTKIGSENITGREQGQLDDSPRLTHPGELVICKKKRKEREKSTVNTRSGSTGPISPHGVSQNMRSPGSGSRDVRLSSSHPQSSQQGWASSPAQPANGVGWANPVKRLRTDAGKRRPSHL